MIMISAKVFCYVRSMKMTDYSIMPVPRVWNIGIDSGLRRSKTVAFAEKFPAGSPG